MNWSVHIDNKKKDMGPTQGLDNTTLTREALYPITFHDQEKYLH